MRRLIMRESWKSIVSKYPGQWVGLTDVKYSNGLAIESAVVRFTENDMPSDQMALETMRGNIVARYTTPDEGNPVGALMIS